MGQCISFVNDVVLSSQQPVTTGGEGEAATTAAAPSTKGSVLSQAGVHKELPAGAELQTVRNVYDGDTLTLVDERRVRFLGIDTPEIKEQQAFAQEAKAYTKDLCGKNNGNKQIWLTYDGDKKDHYGRLLAFVWVQHPSDNHKNAYLCINEGIVAQGLATVYTPNLKKHRLHNWDTLVALQKEARAAKRGMWSTFRDYTVVKTANGAAFHKRSCQHISSVKHLTELSASKAGDMGLHPCRTCLADA
jgi:micrococcal nuclease